MHPEKKEQEKREPHQKPGPRKEPLVSLEEMFRHAVFSRNDTRSRALEVSLISGGGSNRPPLEGRLLGYFASSYAAAALALKRSA